jgi:flagellar hook-basal body complex protein FliE
LIQNITTQPLNLFPLQPKTNTEIGAADLSQQFGTFLNEAITNLSNEQASVDQLNQKFVAGDLPDIHQLMIASEKASLGLELTVQVRNKVIEAYQDVMRMQM